MMKKIRVGFIGVGGIATVHLNNIAKNEHAEIIAVCDISEENVNEQGEKFGANKYTDYEEMLQKESLDAIFISVPPFAHGEMEEKIVEKGIHLLVEKPIELDASTAFKKAKVIRESGVINASGYCLRYLDIVQRAKEYLVDKKIAMVRGHYISGFVSTPWYRVKNQSGGQLVEQATHILDMMTYIAGDIEKVQATMALQVMTDIKNIDIPDVTSVNTSFTSGAIGHLDSSFTQPDHRMGLEVLGRDFRIELTGKTLTIVEKGKTTTYTSNVNFYEEQDNAFIDGVRAKNQDLILASYEDGVKTLVASLAANRSHETEKTVYISEFD